MAVEKSWSETFQDILGGLATTYGVIEVTKANTALAKAQTSWQSMGLPYYYNNPNAQTAGYLTTGSGNNGLLLFGGLAIAVIGVVLLLNRD